MAAGCGEFPRCKGERKRGVWIVKGVPGYPKGSGAADLAAAARSVARSYWHTRPRAKRTAIRPASPRTGPRTVPAPQRAERNGAPARNGSGSGVGEGSASEGLGMAGNGHGVGSVARLQRKKRWSSIAPS